MSRFLTDSSDYRTDESKFIDFDDAIKLPGGGSTCDIYKTRWQRREVFVKRLKEEYRAKPLYLDAFDKEFETGVKLKHPSLPEYRGFNRDYIIMDYIDGATLADMIQRKDVWLTSENNIVKMFRELVEVVDYLHCHHITHCDIKPNNIMITARNHNLVLIDLDKCYTDSLNDTSGDPSKYGVPACNIGANGIDYQGIARIAEILKDRIPNFKFRRYKSFVTACHNENVTTEELISILDYNPRHQRKIGVIVLFAFLMAIMGCIVLYIAHSPVKNSGQSADALLEEKNQTYEIDNSDHPATMTEPAKPNDASPEAVTQNDLHSRAKKRAAIMDKRLKPMYDNLILSLDNLMQLKNDTTLTSEQLLDAIRRYGDKEQEVDEELYAIMLETFPGIDDREYWRILSYSTVYTGYKRQAEPELRAFGKEIERRQASN